MTLSMSTSMRALAATRRLGLAFPSLLGMGTISIACPTSRAPSGNENAYTVAVNQPRTAGVSFGFNF
jgi:hypothetical protein